MAGKKAVFIIGAGASKEVNLPTSNELKQRISNLLDIRYEHGHRKISGDDDIDRALRVHTATKEQPNGEINPYLHAGWRIRDAMPLAISIDNFLDAHGDNEKIELCGKLAIVRAILEAEKASDLYLDKYSGKSQFDYKKFEGTWYIEFFQILTLNCRKESLQDRLSSISLIIFNYDRCVENFIFYALQNYYEISADEATMLCSKISFYHPYGSVGSLPWQSAKYVVEFGAEIDTKRLLEIAGQIKTFTEGTTPDSSEIQAIRSAILTADLAIFLGFAFHNLNLQLISPGGRARVGTKECRVFGTAFQISSSDCEVIKSEIDNLMPWTIGVAVLRNDLTCAKFLSEYRRSISIS